MAAQDRRLDARTVDLVRRAWDALEAQYQKTPTGYHWRDHEADTGPLKDADALLSLIEPFLLARESFLEPPLPFDEICQRCHAILEQLPQLADPSGSPPYLGFTSAPYPYTDAKVDYVDSAATFLRLVCGMQDLGAALQSVQPASLVALQRELAVNAIRFLVDSRIEDRGGVRWAGTALRNEGGVRLASLYFTNVAALSLKKAIENSAVIGWITADAITQVRNALKFVPKWVAAQYSPTMHNFWMDEAQGVVQPVGVVYAIETIYGLLSDVPAPLRESCVAALHAIAQKIPTVERASTLQTDFFHAVPVAGGSAMFYDDRRYIGSFLNALAVIKSRDADVMTDALIRAAEIFVEGVTQEWIDEPSKLWDDGRPLICYTQDALIGTVRYFLEGVVPMITLRENTIRDAVRQALSSAEVVDTVVELLKGKALGQVQEQIAGQIGAVAPKE